MMTLPTGRDQRGWKPWYKRYWLIRGKRREDKQARLVLLATCLAIVPIVFVLAGARGTQVYLPLVALPLSPDPTAELLASPDPIAQLLALVNVARAQAGCGALNTQPQLAHAAEDWSRHMADDDDFQHRDLEQLTSIYGYQFASLGENIAAGAPTAQKVFELWMNSDGHRRNILNCRFSDIGIGMVYLNPDDAPLHYGYYWTQNFGQPVGSNTAAANLQGSASDTPPRLDTPPGLIASAYPPPE